MNEQNICTDGKEPGRIVWVSKCGVYRIVAKHKTRHIYLEYDSGRLDALGYPHWYDLNVHSATARQATECLKALAEEIADGIQYPRLTEEEPYGQPTGS